MRYPLDAGPLSSQNPVIPAWNAGIQKPWTAHHRPLSLRTPVAKQPCVYILASRRNGTLYVGVTSNLQRRVYEHRTNAVPSFTSRYHVHDLVWYEPHEAMESAILREKQLKQWNRNAKLRLIERDNPTWRDLWAELASPSLEPGFRQSLPE